ncbi:hypothetical protein [Arthrobacter sp. VKM Ac-2550]|uniref:hypothetical protein n=1 Tax=Crystallibacter permensis TaxID=1938888 RepID=UPI0022269669|nr:hypothetical protein [Arthrobacter sp. VKM Ac-2550]MCW2131226.1 hypothetical protein [Arthrobacter sp. VKM Ac-2550]
MTTTSTQTYIDFMGNVLRVPAAEIANVQILSTEPPHGRRKAVPDAKVEDWCTLEIDQKVSLWRQKSFVAWGIVDEVRPDGSAAWLFIPNELKRTLVHTSDAFTISLADS